MAVLDLEVLLDIVWRAGQSVLEIYQHREDFVVSWKLDNSPLTLADHESHKIISHGLTSLDDTPILSEEGDLSEWSVRQHWREYWLVDPLDGTHEFIKGNGEFTINIALIREGEPVFGIVYVPVTDVFFYGQKKVGAFRRQGRHGRHEQIHCSAFPSALESWRVVSSRSYSSLQLAELLAALPNHQLTSVGSSLKFCLIAEGKTDIYPRFGPTSEWDTAAAQAVLEAAGGQVLSWQTLLPLRYNTKASLLNPSFVACGSFSACLERLSKSLVAF